MAHTIEEVADILMEKYKQRKITVQKMYDEEKLHLCVHIPTAINLERGSIGGSATYNRYLGGNLSRVAHGTVQYYDVNAVIEGPKFSVGGIYAIWIALKDKPQ